MQATYFDSTTHSHWDKITPTSRARAREIGIKPGLLPTGPLNAITDVPGVRVGHVTLNVGANIRTGVTAILPHAGNVFRHKVAAGVYVGNGFGKLIGSTQIDELGVIESPIVLTNTLSVWRAAEAVASHMLAQKGNERVQSINVVVGETNDGVLNDIRGMHVQKSHVVDAIVRAVDGPVAEGCVGAGTGTVAFGFKGGIGNSSRGVVIQGFQYFLGVLVQTNFGGILTIDGLPIGKDLNHHFLAGDSGDGSVMIIVATDAPLDSRQLKRLARRTMLGVSRTGSPMTHGSGDYAIAFSTPSGPNAELAVLSGRSLLLPDEELTPLFQAVVEATEEAVYNSLMMATTMRGKRGIMIEALPLSVIQDSIIKHQYQS